MSLYSTHLILRATCALAAYLFVSQASAELQSFGPVNFALPVGWGCQIKENNLICLDNSPTSEKNAAIVLNYKYKTAEDVLAVYRDQLARPRTLYDGEIAKPSVPQGVRDVMLNNITWVEGIHLGSEMPDYYTLYYVTVVEPYAILLSISVEKSSYQSKLSFIKNTISSIKVNVANQNADHSLKTGDSRQAVAGQRNTVNESRLHNRKFSTTTLTVLGLGLLGVIGLLIYAIKS